MALTPLWKIVVDHICVGLFWVFYFNGPCIYLYVRTTLLIIIVQYFGIRSHDAPNLTIPSQDYFDYLEFYMIPHEL